MLSINVSNDIYDTTRPNLMKYALDVDKIVQMVPVYCISRSQEQNKKGLK